MKILIVTHVIFPYKSPRSFRSTELAKEFARKGHEVTVYTNTGGYNYDWFQKEYSIKVVNFKRLFLVKKNSSMTVEYGLFEKIMIILFRRRLFYPNIEFLFNIKKSLRYEKNYDLMVSVAAPHSIHWGVAWALKRNPSLTKQWIADCGDPFMFNQFEHPPFYFKYLEKWFCRKADFITIPIENAKTAYYPEFRSKLRVIPQGFNFDDVKLFEGEINNTIPTFAYAGMVYKTKRDPSNLLNFLSKLDLDFKFIVYTADSVIFHSYKSILGDKMEIREYIPRIKLLYELSKMDFLINIENLNKEQSPSKIIDYALTLRPILNIASDVIYENEIMDFIKGDYSLATEVEIGKYDIKDITNKFLLLS